MALEKVDIANALNKSIKDNGTFHRVYGCWMAQLERMDECVYKATMWNDDNGLAFHAIGIGDDTSSGLVDAARKLHSWYVNELYPKHPSQTIYEWYRDACPTDPERHSIEVGPTFAMYLAELAKSGDPYIFGIDDSIVRQRVMDATAHVMGLRYDYLSDMIR